MSEPTDEVYQALSDQVRAGVTAASEIAALVAHHRAEQARAAQHASETEARRYTERMRAERAAAAPVMRQPWNERWWQRANPEQVATTWQVTAGWAGVKDPYAQTTLRHMRQQLIDRYGVEVPESGIEPSDLAKRLATGTAEEPQEQASTEDAVVTDAEQTAAHMDGEEDLQVVDTHAGHGQDMRAAAEQDRDAAAVLESIADQEAATAVTVAAEGFPVTPSERLAAGARQARRPGRGPRANSRQRESEQGR